MRGLLIDGGGIQNFNVGITYFSGILNVQDCVLRNLEFYGIWIIGPQAYVSNTVISDNTGSGGVGVYVNPMQSQNQGTKVTLNRMEIVNNFNGINIDGDSLADSGVAWVSVNDSVIAGSGAQGIWAHNNGNPNAHSFITAMVTRSSIVDGKGTAIISQGTGALVQLNQSTIANNVIGWSATSGGTVMSFGNNVLSDNASAGDGAPTLRALE